METPQTPDRLLRGLFLVDWNSLEAVPPDLLAAI